MYILRFLLLFIFIFSCNTETIRKEIIIGKTIKIEATNFGSKNLSNNYNFLWSKPISPNNSMDDVKFSIENNKMLITPYSVGNYDISLTIENLNNTNLYQETFSFYAIDNPDSPALTKPIINRIENKASNKMKIWTIQIMSDPSIEKAKKKQAELNEKGFDAYTESIFIESKNQEYWRVRIGNFTNKQSGSQIVKSLNELGYETWFTSFYE
tara:strand:- start:344 stop:976 length:633 start_codon:yes stop_codon:yes gene_type:complete